MPSLLHLGVLGRSAKENEHRLPIHPRHFDRIAAELRPAIWLEPGYGEQYGVSDAELAPLVAGFRPRAELMAASDVLLLPKPTVADAAELREGATLWGWPHCVQDVAMTSVAIQRRLTLIAWEAMNHWTDDGRFQLHVFHVNNELAGYASVLHALTLRGFTGHYGRRRRAVLLGFGNTARGAATALHALGISDVVALTMRDVQAVAAPIPNVTLGGLERDPADPAATVTLKSTGAVPTVDFLAEFDIVVNCVLQDTDDPVMFVRDDDVARLGPGTVIVDVSCDEGMGFSFARPTTFDDPMFEVGHDVHYYGVDHSPSLLWESATWENSQALLPHLPTVLAGPAAWEADQTIRRAIEIQDGVIRNPKIRSFQHRAAAYPHPVVR